MASIFSRIVSGEIPAYKVLEDDRFLAFLDITPLVEGHVLIIPKKETDYIFDVADEDYADLWLFARKVAKGLKQAVPCIRVGVAVIGLEVPHAHIHLVPLNRMGDINFQNERAKVSPARMTELAAAIGSKIQ